MHKKYIPFAALLVILLVLLAHIGVRLTASVPAFTFAEEEKEVYLTFDDGPSTRVTPRILDILEEENVTATFFVVGDRIAGREDILRRIVKDGHTVGVHSQTHRYSEIYASDKALLADVDACSATIERVTGNKPNVYRFPFGGPKERKRLTPLIEAKGYKVVGWNAVCGDEEIRGASADALYAETVKTAKGIRKVVLLCHDSTSHAPTAEALPRIIAYFREAGYAFRAF